MLKSSRMKPAVLALIALFLTACDDFKAKGQTQSSKKRTAAEEAWERKPHVNIIVPGIHFYNKPSTASSKAIGVLTNAGQRLETGQMLWPKITDTNLPSTGPEWVEIILPTNDFGSLSAAGNGPRTVALKAWVKNECIFLRVDTNGYLNVPYEQRELMYTDPRKIDPAYQRDPDSYNEILEGMGARMPSEGIKVFFGSMYSLRQQKYFEFRVDPFPELNLRKAIVAARVYNEDIKKLIYHMECEYFDTEYLNLQLKPDPIDGMYLYFEKQTYPEGTYSISTGQYSGRITKLPRLFNGSFEIQEMCNDGDSMRASASTKEFNNTSRVSEHKLEALSGRLTLYYTLEANGVSYTFSRKNFKYLESKN